MTDPARWREILGSYGGRNDRWPERERESLLAALRGDAALRALRVEALGLDAMLDHWARRDLSTGSDAGAAAARALRPSRRWPWAAAGGLAASAAAVLLLLPGLDPAPPRAAHLTAISAEGAFTGLFTTTPDEEDLI